MVSFALLLLLIVLIFIIYRLLLSYKATLIYNPSGDMASIMSSMKTPSKPYKPTPWLIGGNMQTIMGMRFRGKTSFRCRRDQITMEDGGTCILDWFEPSDAKDDAPIVGIIHTLAGGTREPCTNYFAYNVMKRGWRAVVLNCRSCSGAPITSKRLFNALQIDDQQAMVKHVLEQYNPKYFFLAGFSLGSMQAINYVIDPLCESIRHVDGLFLVSHVYDTNASAMILEKPLESKLYLSVIVQKLTHALKKNQYVSEDMKKAVHAKTLCEFDDLFTSQTLGLKDHHEYYEKVKIYNLIPKINVPTLILGSDDDPFTEKKFQPISEVQKSNDVALMTYPTGGHVSFLTGMSGKKSIIDPIGLDFFDTIISQK